MTLNSPLQSPFASYHSLSPLEIPNTPASSTQESPISSRTSRATRFESVLKILRDGRMSPIDLMLEILDPSNAKYDWYRTGLFHTSPEKVRNMLDLMMQHDRGSTVITDWLRPQVAEWACKEVYREMDAAKDALLLSGGVGDLTPEYLETWSQSNILGTASAEAPILLSILHAGAQTQKAREKNTKKTSHLVRHVYLSDIHRLTLSIRHVRYWSRSLHTSVPIVLLNSTVFSACFYGPRDVSDRQLMLYFGAGSLSPMTRSLVPFNGSVNYVYNGRSASVEGLIYAPMIISTSAHQYMLNSVVNLVRQRFSLEHLLSFTSFAMQIGRICYSLPSCSASGTRHLSTLLPTFARPWSRQYHFTSNLLLLLSES